MENARFVALKALIKMENDESYSNITIDSALKKYKLSSNDSAFASALFYGVLERRITIDYILKRYLKKPLNKMDIDVLNILRLGIYQLKFMEKVPDNAAVNESVKLISMVRKTSAKGLCNAVLRNFIRDNKEYTLPSDDLEQLSIEYSVPIDFAKSLCADYGFDCAKGILHGFLASKYLSIRVNTTKISTDEYLSKLIENGVDAKSSPIVEDCLIINNSGDVRQLYGYNDGLFHVQDSASQLAVKALHVLKDSTVLDVCSAPGGKTFTAAEYTSEKVISCDLYEHKVKLIEDGAKRLSLNNVKAIVNDASVFNEKLGIFDRVLCDLPCSGMGILGKKPEIRYKNVTFVDKLSEIQYNLLVCSKNYLKMGGILVYSTCTLNHKENRNVASKFLKENEDFEPFEIFPDIERAIDEPNNMLTLMPHIHGTDGFFISAFKKKGC